MISGIKKSLVRLIVLFASLAALSLAAAADRQPLPWVEGSTTVVLLPDTQFYTDKYPEFHFFEAQTQWIAEHRHERNIAYVLHLGDITDHNVAAEWKIARNAFRTLDGKVPYALVPGNHDYDGLDRKTLLNKYFPVAEQRKMPTFGGLFEDGKLDNSFHCFRIAGRKWIALALECGPRDEVVTWANEVLDQHPDHLALLVTHAYLYNDNTRFDHKSGRKQKSGPHKWGNDGEELWQKLLKQHANMMLVVCGHVAKGGLGYLASQGDHGNTVHQVLVDYQSCSRGGEAYLRLLEFLPDGKTVQARSYSPAVDRYKTDAGNQFVFTLKIAKP